MLYPVVIHVDEGSAYGVTVPDLAGCFSAGDTLEEAVENVKEAIDFHLEGMVEEEGICPQPTDLAALSKKTEYEGGVWLLVDVDVTKYLGKADRLNITLPHFLVTKIDKTVEEDKRFKSRSHFLAEASMRMLSHA